MSRPAGLGRGLSALLGEIGAREQPADGEPATAATPGVRLIPVGSIEPHPAQPRRHFAEAALDELAQSIAVRGVIQPIVVRAHGSIFQIVAGERRWRAAQRARLAEIPAIVREFDESTTLQIALLENIQRQDLNAIEEAQAYRRLIDEFGHSQEALAREVHKSRSHVTNLLRLLDLPASVQTRVVEGVLSMGHARALIGAGDVEALAEEVVAKGLSVRDTEKLARRAKAARGGGEGSGGGGGAGDTADADIAALETQLADMLGLAVRVAFGEKGGTLTLGFGTLDQLDMLCQRLSGEAI